MQLQKARVVIEKYELDEKLVEIKEFCSDPGSPKFNILPQEDRDLLVKQMDIMNQYSQILGQRITLFPKGI